MSNPDLPNLQAFVVECLQAVGGVVEIPEYGLAEVLLPDAMAGAFGGRTFLRVAFDPEVAREHPDAELAVYGSEFLDRMSGLAAQLGRAAVRYVYVNRLDVTRIPERLMQQFQFVNCRPFLEGHAVADFGYVLFHFKLIYLTDEREEALCDVLVDQNANRPVQDVEGFLKMATFLPSPQIICPQEPGCSVHSAYRTACAFLRQRARDAFLAQKEKRRRLLEADLERIHTYYDDLKEETEKRLARISDAGRADGLRHRLEVYEVERARRKKELEDKHALRLEAQLTSAELLVQPKIVHAVRIAHRDRSARLNFVWDPLLKTFEPPICERCGEALRTFAFDKAGQIACWGRGPEIA